MQEGQTEVDFIEVATLLGERYKIGWFEFLEMPLLLVWAYYEWGVYYMRQDIYIQQLTIVGAG